MTLDTAVLADLAAPGGSFFASEDHHVNALFGWDFRTKPCRVCRGDIPLDDAMPEGWSNRGHSDTCPTPAVLAEVESLRKAVRTLTLAYHTFNGRCTTDLSHCTDTLCVEGRALVSEEGSR